MQALGGEQHARYATKSHGAIAAKHRASEGKHQLGALAFGGRLHIEQRLALYQLLPLRRQ